MRLVFRAVTAAVLVCGTTTHLAGLRQNPVVFFEIEKGAIEIEAPQREEEECMVVDHCS